MTFGINDVEYQLKEIYDYGGDCANRMASFTQLPSYLTVEQKHIPISVVIALACQELERKYPSNNSS